MRKATTLLFVFALAAVAVSGCTKKEGSAPAASAPAATTGAPAAAPSGDSVGVPECDDYITKYQSCLKGKIPEAAQAAMKGAFDTTVAEWKKVAATPEGKSGLAMACKSALDASKQAMGAYGCEW
jgi:hypothetical protein